MRHLRTHGEMRVGKKLLKTSAGGLKSERAALLRSKSANLCLTPTWERESQGGTEMPNRGRGGFFKPSRNAAADAKLLRAQQYRISQNSCQRNNRFGIWKQQSFASPKCSTIRRGDWIVRRSSPLRHSTGRGMSEVLNRGLDLCTSTP